MGPDAGSQPAGVIRLVPGRDRPAVEDLPGDVMAAADLLADSDDRVAVFVDGALPAPAAVHRLDAVAEKFFPESHRRGVWVSSDKSVPPMLSIRSVLRRPFDYRKAEYKIFILPSSVQSHCVKMANVNMKGCGDVRPTFSIAPICQPKMLNS
jgi:hypothetical protein